MSELEADDELPPDAVKPKDAMDEDLRPTYTSQLHSRAAAIAAIRSPPSTNAFSLESILTLPHLTPVHSLALPSHGHSLLTGGADGFVRRYAFYDSLNGIDSPKNLVMKSATVTSGVLLGYWENAEAGEVEEGGLRYGPRSVSNSMTGGKAGGSPVHSLAVQSQELWGLSGAQNGEIYLFTVRHDEGQVRHVFRSSADSKTGHAAKSPISVLTLTGDERGVMSGGWDGRVLQWDLNTGKIAHTYNERDYGSSDLRSRQISSISFRPEGSAPASEATVLPVTPRRSSRRASTVAEAEPDGAESPVDFDPLFDKASAASSPGVAAGLTGSLPSRSQPDLPAFGEASLPLLSDDVLLSSSIDGQVLLWDRRTDGRGAIRRLPVPEGTPPWSMQAGWSRDGQRIYVGRRDAAIDVYDLRSGSMSKLRLPPLSGPVTAIQAMPGDRYLTVASYDTLRLYDLEGEGEPAWRIGGNHYGTTISEMVVDASGSFVVAAAGGRGWTSEGAMGSADGCMVYEVCPVW